jgi:hypothetical protein
LEPPPRLRPARTAAEEVYRNDDRYAGKIKTIVFREIYNGGFQRAVTREAFATNDMGILSLVGLRRLG